MICSGKPMDGWFVAMLVSQRRLSASSVYCRNFRQTGSDYRTDHAVGAPAHPNFYCASRICRGCPRRRVWYLPKMRHKRAQAWPTARWISLSVHTPYCRKTGFKRLGLVVVDEEQHFGSPIRSGLKTCATSACTDADRDPHSAHIANGDGGRARPVDYCNSTVDRLAVRTYVSPFDKVSLREAPAREVSGRMKASSLYRAFPTLRLRIFCQRMCPK